MNIISKFTDFLKGGLSSDRLTEASTWGGVGALAMALFSWNAEQWGVVQVALVGLAGVISYFWKDKGSPS